MGGPTIQTMFESADWINKLRRYATCLIGQLERDLTAIAATGISLKAVDRQSLTIDPYRSEKDDDYRRAEGMFLSRPADPLSDHSQKDVAFLQTWLAQPDSNPRPLLLLAPFGCGKSVTLGLFTLLLARTLRNWCESKKDPLPWVPFPVRLRELPGNEPLWDYMTTTAQKHVNPDLPDAGDPASPQLTAKELRQLRDHRRLLPLFDGLDELPESDQNENKRSSTPRADAIRQIYQDPYYGQRHVLSSREGHGAENSIFTATATLHTLHALNATEAETFIRSRLGIAPGDTEHPILARYRKAQPAINELFRRPLFLMVWCTKARAWHGSRGRKELELPTSLSGLMEAILEHVLDKRLSDHEKGPDADFSRLKKELLDNRHRLGAVLAIHADIGFGKPVQRPAQRVEDGSHRHAFKDAEQYERYARFAMKAGLLIERSNGTYAEKIPVVEYLIGYYYAWLAREHKDDELARSRHRQLASSFQRRFWWFDHVEVWMYAFEILWHGETAQREMAANLIRWTLELSDRCIRATDWDGPVPEGQEDDRRGPFPGYSLALRVLLPTGNLSPEAEKGVAKLIKRAFGQLKSVEQRAWKRSHHSGVRVHGLVQRQSRLILDWLLGCLKNAKYKQVWSSIIYAMKDASAHLGQNEFDLLLGCLKDAGYKREWVAISRSLRTMSAYLGQSEVALLLGCLMDMEYQEAWDTIAQALGEAAPHLCRNEIAQLLGCLKKTEYRHAWHSITRTLIKAVPHPGQRKVALLLGCLQDAEYKQSWGSIASALGDASAYLGHREVAVLVDCLKDAEYKQEWSSIASALGNASAYLGQSEVAVLVVCLKDAEYSQAWGSIASALGDASAHLSQSEVALLGGCLKDAEYSQAWSLIASALGSASAHLGQREVLLLESCLKDVEYKQAWGSIAYALGKASAHLGQSGIALLRGCLRDAKYRRACSFIAFALGDASVHLNQREMGQLLGYLKNADFMEAWEFAGVVGQMCSNEELFHYVKGVANRSAGGGRISYAWQIVGTIPGLIPYVRDVNANAKAGRRIIYGIAEPNDPELLLNLKFAPTEIQQLLETESERSWKIIQTRSKDGGLEAGDVVDAISVALADHQFTPKQKQHFKHQMLKTANQSHRVRYALRIIREKLDPDQRKGFILRGTLEIPKSGKLSKQKAAAAKDEENAPPGHLLVNCTMLLDILHNPLSRPLLEQIYTAVAGEQGTLVEGDSGMKALMCRKCRRIHEIADGSTRPPFCLTCNTVFIKNDIPVKFPDQVLQCPKCEGKPFFALKTVSGKSRLPCPKEGCGAMLRVGRRAGG